MSALAPKTCLTCHWCEPAGRYSLCNAPQNLDTSIREDDLKLVDPELKSGHQRRTDYCVSQRKGGALRAWFTNTCGKQGRWWQAETAPAISTLQVFHQLHMHFNDASVGPLRKVATLTSAKPLADALEDAFTLTNHITHAWNDKHPPELIPERGRHRSTSAGDVVVVNDAQAFQCAPDGWKERDIGVVRAMVVP